MLGPYSNQLVEWSWAKYRRDLTDNKQNAQIWEVGEEAKWKWNERLRSNYSRCAKRMGQLILVKPAGTMGQPLRREAEGVCEPAKQRHGEVYGKAFQQIAAVGLLTPTESCVSHCDLFAQLSVLMASLRGTWDSRAQTQGAARGSLADLGMEGHSSPWCCRRAKGVGSIPQPRAGDNCLWGRPQTPLLWRWYQKPVAEPLQQQPGKSMENSGEETLTSVCRWTP